MKVISGLPEMKLPDFHNQSAEDHNCFTKSANEINSITVCLQHHPVHSCGLMHINICVCAHPKQEY